MNNIETVARLQGERYNDFIKEAARLRLAQLPQAHGMQDVSGRQQGRPVRAASALAHVLRAALQECTRAFMPSGPNGNDRGSYV